MTYAHQILSYGPKGTAPMVQSVHHAIARASARTGVDFSYLMNKAQIESNFDPSARSTTSSARGLYQFTQKTWLQMVRDFGEKYGLGRYAAAIDEKCRVGDAGTRQKILDLRNDPETSACMAAEYAAQNAEILQKNLGGAHDIGDTELYLAHFLGPGGASKFLSALQEDPQAPASELFQTEARANKGIFFDPKTGQSKSLQQIYDRFAARMNEEGDTKMASSALKSQDNFFSLAQGSSDLLDAPSDRFVDDLLAAPSGIRPLRPGTLWNVTRSPESAEQALSQAALLVMIQDQRDQNGFNT